MKKKMFQIYECCIPVKGQSRSIIYDLQRKSFHFIPNGLYEILKKHKSKTIEEIKENYINQLDGIIDEYFEFLISNEYGFWTDEPHRFPQIDLTYESPEIINNAIIDFDKKSNHPIDKIFQELSLLRTKFLEIRFFDDFNIKTLNELILKSKNTALNNIDIYLKYNNKYDGPYLWHKLLKNNSIIGNIYIHSAPKTERLKGENLYKVCFLKQEICSEKQCGIISLEQFNINIPMFSESLHYNTCLNKKICIDKNGLIKNCPSMSKNYGNIIHESLSNAVNNEDFKSMWFIKKDDITTCQVCEFRFMCTDCRAFLKEPSNIYSKPLKCGYNPHSNSWSDWSKEPLNLESIKFYNL